VIANAPTAIILAMIVVEARRGFSLKDIHLALQNDIQRVYRRGNYIFPPGPSMRLFTDVLEYCTEYLPNSILSILRIPDEGEQGPMRSRR
jgi:methylmalonyl-CoA mutase N-terminal domain/subunit